VTGLPPNFDRRSFEMTQNVHDGAVVSLLFRVAEQVVDFANVFMQMNADLTAVLRQFILHGGGIKHSINIKTKLERVGDGFTMDRDFIGPFITITHPNFIQSQTSSSLGYLSASLSLYERDGSGWRVVRIYSALVRIALYQPQLRRATRGQRIGGQYIPLPPSLNRKSIININTNNNDCFMLSVVASVYLHCVRLPNHPTLTFDEMNSYQRDRIKKVYQSKRTWQAVLAAPGMRLNFAGFRSNVAIERIGLFEEKNPSISINVYGLQGEALVPIRVSKSWKATHVDLLYLENERDEGGYGHYALIRELGKFFGKKGYKKTEVCRVCFLPFSEGTSRHLSSCQGLNDERKISLPIKDFYRFDKHFMHMEPNFKILFRIQYYSEPYIFTTPATVNESRFTRPMNSTEVAGYSIAVFDAEWDMEFNETYFGLDAIEQLMKSIYELSMNAIAEVATTYVPLAVNDEMRERKKLTKFCPLCHEEFNDNDRLPAFNHTHITGEYFHLKVYFIYL
jgi:hypothetical protein